MTVSANCSTCFIAAGCNAANYLRVMAYTVEQGTGHTGAAGSTEGESNCAAEDVIYCFANWVIQ